MDKEIRRENKLPGCESFTRPEELTILSKYLKAKKEFLEDNLELPEETISEPDFLSTESLDKRKEMLSSGPDISRLNNRAEKLSGVQKVNLTDTKEKLSAEEIIRLSKNTVPLSDQNDINLDKGREKLSGVEDIPLSFEKSSLNVDKNSALNSSLEKLEVPQENKLNTNLTNLNIGSENTALENKIERLQNTNDIPLDETRRDLEVPESDISKEKVRLVVNSNDQLNPDKVKLENLKDVSTLDDKIERINVYDGLTLFNGNEKLLVDDDRIALSSLLEVLNIGNEPSLSDDKEKLTIEESTELSDFISELNIKEIEELDSTKPKIKEKEIEDLSSFLEGLTITEQGELINKKEPLKDALVEPKLETSAQELGASLGPEQLEDKKIGLSTPEIDLNPDLIGLRKNVDVELDKTLVANSESQVSPQELPDKNISLKQGDDIDLSNYREPGIPNREIGPEDEKGELEKLLGESVNLKKGDDVDLSNVRKDIEGKEVDLINDKKNLPDNSAITPEDEKGELEELLGESVNLKKGDDVDLSNDKKNLPKNAALSPEDDISELEKLLGDLSNISENSNIPREKSTGKIKTDNKISSAENLYKNKILNEGKIEENSNIPREKSTEEIEIKDKISSVENLYEDKILDKGEILFNDTSEPRQSTGEIEIKDKISSAENLYKNKILDEGEIKENSNIPREKSTKEIEIKDKISSVENLYKNKILDEGEIEENSNIPREKSTGEIEIKDKISSAENLYKNKILNEGEILFNDTSEPRQSTGEIEIKDKISSVENLYEDKILDKGEIEENSNIPREKSTGEIEIKDKISSAENLYKNKILDEGEIEENSNIPREKSTGEIEANDKISSVENLYKNKILDEERRPDNDPEHYTYFDTEAEGGELYSGNVELAPRETDYEGYEAEDWVELDREAAEKTTEDHDSPSKFEIDNLSDKTPDELGYKKLVDDVTALNRPKDRKGQLGKLNWNDREKTKVEENASTRETAEGQIINSPADRIGQLEDLRESIEELRLLSTGDEDRKYRMLLDVLNTYEKFDGVGAGYLKMLCSTYLNGNVPIPENVAEKFEKKLSESSVVRSLPVYKNENNKTAIRALAEELVGTTVKGSWREILLDETIATLILLRDKIERLGGASPSSLPGKRESNMFTLISAMKSAGAEKYKSSVATIANLFSDNQGPINRPGDNEFSSLLASSSVWERPRGNALAGTDVADKYKQDPKYIFFSEYLNGRGMDITANLLGKENSAQLPKSSRSFLDLMKKSPFFSTANNCISTDFDSFRVQTLDSNNNWEVALYPYLSEYNGGFSYLPGIFEINNRNTHIHGTKTDYEWWIPITSLDIQLGKMSSKSLQLYHGEVFFPYGFEAANEIRITIADDQYKSWRMYFETCMFTSIYSSRPHYEDYYSEKNQNALTVVDKNTMLASPYKNVSFVFYAISMTPQMSTIKVFPYLVVLKDFTEEFSGEIDGGAGDLTVSFSIVGKLVEGVNLTESAKNGVRKMTAGDRRILEASNPKKNKAKAVTSSVISGPIRSGISILT